MAESSVIEMGEAVKKKIKSIQGHPRGYSVAFGGPSHCVSTIIALINTSTFATIAFVVVVVVNQVKSSFSPAIAYYNIIDERRPPEPQKHISHRPIFRFSTFNYPVIFPSIPYHHPSSFFPFPSPAMSSTLPRPSVTISTPNNPPSSDTIVASSPLAAVAPGRRSQFHSGEGLSPMKRRKISPEMFEPAGQTQSPFTGHPRNQQPPPQAPYIPIAALLYHSAQVAHQTSHVHLQQAFVPTQISTDRTSGSSIIKLYSYSSTSQSSQSNRFSHDPHAFAKALGLQLYALDLLRAGLDINSLSDKEKVAFSLEFGVVGMKVYMAQQILQSKSKGKEKIEGVQVDCQRLMDDMQNIVGQAVCMRPVSSLR